VEADEVVARVEADAVAGERAQCSAVGGDHDVEKREKEEDSPRMRLRWSPTAKCRS
jgi:hypothetical protein